MNAEIVNSNSDSTHGAVLKSIGAKKLCSNLIRHSTKTTCYNRLFSQALVARLVRSLRVSRRLWERVLVINGSVLWQEACIFNPNNNHPTLSISHTTQSFSHLYRSRSRYFELDCSRLATLNQTSKSYFI